VISFTPRPFYPQGKIPWYALDRRLSGPQNLSGMVYSRIPIKSTITKLHLINIVDRRAKKNGNKRSSNSKCS
jgi:hypothetical protein